MAKKKLSREKWAPGSGKYSLRFLLVSVVMKSTYVYIRALPTEAEACAHCSSTTAWDQTDKRERARKRIRLAFVVDRLHFTCKFWHSSECESLSLDVVDVVDADSSADGPIVLLWNHPFLWSCCCSCSSSKVCHCAGPVCAPLSLCVSVSDTHRLCCLRLQF